LKAVILAGGLGTRFSEETVTKPKPMIEIGGRPILWHIMKMYSHYGINDFIVCCGYKSYFIKEYFLNYHMHESDITVNLADGVVDVHRTVSEPWRVTLVDTGPTANTGGRIKQIAPFVDGTFCMTYGDGVADVDVRAVIDLHRRKGKACTLTAVQPAGRYGVLEIADDASAIHFNEKPVGDGAWINGGFFVLEPTVFDYIDGIDTIWEREAMHRLIGERQVAAYRHTGFWQCMDTQRDQVHLEALWRTPNPPWKVWGQADK
jgi:glucose-1-phosphate cytidylyltransferase